MNTRPRLLETKETDETALLDNDDIFSNLKDIEYTEMGRKERMAQKVKF